MINDCAFIGETLIKYLPQKMEAVHFKRSRRLLDKTLGIAWKILKADGDIYHVHYLLQDCFFALKLGKKPLIGHAHGTDLRQGLKHKIWGKLVRYNLKHCNKILVSTPDLLDNAEKYNENAEYLPNPIDRHIFYLKPLVSHNGKRKVLIAARCDWRAKGTDKVIRALSKIKNEIEIFIIRYGNDFAKTLELADSLELKLNVLPRVTHKNVREYFWCSDVVIASIGAGVLGMVALEAISCGRPVITYVSSRYPEYKDFPLKDINTIDRISDAVMTADDRLWRDEFNYIEKNHDIKNIIGRLLKVYFNIG